MFLVVVFILSSQVNAKTIAWCHTDLADDLYTSFNIYCNEIFPFRYRLGDIDDDGLDEFGGYCTISNTCAFPVENGIYCGDGPCKCDDSNGVCDQPGDQSYYWIPASNLEEYQTGNLNSKKIKSVQIYTTDFINKTIRFYAYNDVDWQTAAEINRNKNVLLNDAYANLEYVIFPYIPIIQTSYSYSTWKNYFNNKATRKFYRNSEQLNESYEKVLLNSGKYLYKWNFYFSNPLEVEVFALYNIGQKFAIVMELEDGTNGNGETQTCSDGTPYGECNDNGQRCVDGTLVNDTSCISQPSNGECVVADYKFDSSNIDSYEDNLFGSKAVLGIEENDAPESAESSLRLIKQAQGISYLVFPVDVQQGEKYVVSAWIKTSQKNFARLFATKDTNTFSPLPDTESVHIGNGEWKHLFYTFTASGDYIKDGKHYIVVAAGSSQNTNVGEFKLYELNAKKDECFITPVCSINGMQITDDCGYDGCRKGNNITIDIEYDGVCANKMFIQMDAKSQDELCFIQNENENNVQGFIQGMDFVCTQSPCKATWQIPEIPSDCYAKQVEINAIELWEHAIGIGDFHGNYGPINLAFPSFYFAPECLGSETKCSDDEKAIIICSNGKWDYDNSIQCQENETCYQGRCIPTRCVDGTLPGECSTQNKGKKCVDNNHVLELVDNFTCGCPDGYYPDKEAKQCKPAEDICISEGIGFAYPNSQEKAMCENTNGTYKAINQEIGIGEIKVNCAINYTCECPQGSVLRDGECISTCNNDGICDLRVESLVSCPEDCIYTTRCLNLDGNPTTNGYKFIGDTCEIPQKMWVCNADYDFSVCISACEAGNTGIDSPCICKSTLGDCQVECYDKTGQAYIVLEDSTGKKFIKQITYECVQYGVDKLTDWLNYFKDLHKDLCKARNEYIELIAKDPDNPDNKEKEEKIEAISEALLILEPFIPYLEDVIQNPTYTSTTEAHKKINEIKQKLDEILKQGLITKFRIVKVEYNKIVPMYSDAEILFDIGSVAPSLKEAETRWINVNCYVTDPSGQEHEINTSCEKIIRSSIGADKKLSTNLYLDKKGNWTIDSCELYVSMYDDCSYSVNYHTKENVGSIYAMYVPLVKIENVNIPSSVFVNDRMNITLDIVNNKSTTVSMNINCTMKDPDNIKYKITSIAQSLLPHTTTQINLTKIMHKKGKWLLEQCSLHYINGTLEHSKSINKNIDVDLPDFVLDPLFLKGSVRQGDQIKYDLSLNNTGRTTNFTFSLTSSQGWWSQFLVNDEEKNETRLQKNEKALIKVYVKYVNATSNSTIKLAVKSAEGLEKTATIHTILNTTNNPPYVDVDDINEVNENEVITFTADINDIDGDDITEAKVCMDPDCYNVYCVLTQNENEYSCVYENSLPGGEEYEYYVMAKDSKGAQTISDVHQFTVSVEPAQTCDAVQCPGTNAECYCLDGECKPCPVDSQCVNNRCMPLITTECGDGFCDVGEDCPEDCGQEIDFTWLIIIFVIILIAGGVYYYKVRGETHETIFK